MSVLLTIAAVVLAAAPARDWVVTLDERDGTQMQMRMTAEIGPDRWELYTRPGAVNEMINWRQRLLGTLFRRLPPHRALIVGSGTVQSSGDSLLLRGVMESQFLGTRVVVGSLRGDRLHAELRRGSDSGAVAGVIDGVPSTSTAPLRDYRAISANVRRTITSLVFDPSIPPRPNMQAFFSQFDAAAARAQDDVDLVGSFYALSPLIGISHFNLFRNPRLAATPLDSIVNGDQNVDPSTLVLTQFYGQGALAFLRVSRWDRVEPYVDRAFERLDSAHTKVLILDLRGNPGGDATSMSPVAHLFRDTVFVGGFVGRPWFATHDRTPTPSELKAFPLMTTATEAKSLLTSVTTVGGTQGRVPPKPPRFDGPVFVLVDHATASASEPLAYVLESTHRASLVGERTAGRMLTALPHPVGADFLLTVPEADYYTADATRLEGLGVDVSIPAPPGEELIVVGKRVAEIEPYAGWSWLGNAYFTLRRYAESESAWGRALELAPSEVAKSAVRARIEAARKARASSP